ncbi:MAG: YkgJ family cysteine cluster protein, partial [Gemmataceae bacterium]
DMAMPIKSLPVVQRWDCHATGSCCKEYRIELSQDEAARIAAQGWTKEELGGLEPVVRSTTFGKGLQLNHRADGACVFLDPEGKCRIHARFGYETKPLPCRLFPFILIPAGTEWRVGMRFACPSVATNKGRTLPEHDADLRSFAMELVQREKLDRREDGSLVPPPRQDGGESLDWPDTLRLVDGLLGLIRKTKEPIEYRWRKLLHLAASMKQAKLKHIRGKRLSELLELLAVAADQEVPREPTQEKRPSWVARILFRQTAALFTRKDHGPYRGEGLRSPLSRLSAAWRFARGVGQIPRLHKRLPLASFEDAEQPRGPLPSEADEVLTRYYAIKIGSLQFCGATSFGLPFWRGLEFLGLTLPLLLWASRLFPREVPRDQALCDALTVIDDHYGFNRVLASFRQQWSFTLLAGELPRLVAWYAR